MAAGFAVTSTSAYEVWMGTSKTPGSAATYTNTWSRAADQVEGLNINRAPNEIDPATKAEWQTVFSFIRHADNGFGPIPRSAFESDRHPNTTLEDLLDSKFAEAVEYGFGLNLIMFYNNAVDTNNYSWTTNEVQRMRDHLDATGHTNVGLMWNARLYNNDNRDWCENPLVTDVLLEANPSKWFDNTGNRQTLLQWLWTNSVTASKKLVFQIPGDSPEVYGEVRRLVYWLGNDLMSWDFLRSPRVVFTPVTYDNMPFYPELHAPDQYTNSSTSLVLSLLEQRDLFEARTRVITTNEVLSFARNTPPTISSITDRLVLTGTTNIAVPFTVNDEQTDALALAVSSASSNPALVSTNALAFSGADSNRTLTLTLGPLASGSSTITVIVSDGTNETHSTFLLTVGGSNPFVAITNGDLHAGATWTGGFAPVPGDTNLWLSAGYSLGVGAAPNNTTSTFHGQTLVIETGGELNPDAVGPTLQVNYLILDGGRIYHNRNIAMTLDLTGDTLTLNSGSIRTGAANSRHIRIANGSLAGSGTIDLTSQDPSYTNKAEHEILNTVNTAGFTGVFNVTDNADLNLPPIATPTFGLSVSGTGFYVNDANVSLTSLTLGTNVIPPGVHTYASFGPAEQAFLGDNGGVITVVSPVNTPPTLDPIADQTLIAGQTLLVTNNASDTDVPAQMLTFSLLSAPLGAAINPTNGLITWRPQIAQSPTTNDLSVAVTDDGTPGLSATQNFTVTVAQPVAPSLTSPAYDGRAFSMTINGDTGPDYTILGSTNLTDWTTLLTTNGLSVPLLFADPDSSSFDQRFYRVLLGP
jgi:hypothetical protein